MKKFVRRRADWWRENRRFTPSSSSTRRRYADLVLLLCLPGGLWLGGSVLTRYAEHHPYFSVKEVLIEETAGFSPEDIQEWGGVKVGMSMWEVEPEQVESRLLSHSWLQSAHVRRDFPQRVHISVSARRPVAVVFRENLIYLDDSGACFAKPEQSPVADLPYVSGMAQLALESSSARSAFEGVLHLLSLAHLWQEPLSEIHWDPQQGYTLFLERRRVTIRLGWETTPEKFAQIGVVLAEWREDAPTAVFDARFAGQIVVRSYAGENSTQSRALSRPL
jgi:hypothetical protein